MASREEIMVFKNASKPHDQSLEIKRNIKNKK